MYCLVYTLTARIKFISIQYTKKRCDALNVRIFRQYIIQTRTKIKRFTSKALTNRMTCIACDRFDGE